MKDPTQILDVKDWYSCDVPRKQFKALLKKSNGPAFVYFGGWLAMLGASGYLAYYLLGSYWAIPVFFLYGVIYSSCNAKWHECSHGTPFRINWLNEFFYFLCGAMEFRDPVDFGWSHLRHHSYTLMSGVDPEIATPRPPKLLHIMLEFFAIKALLDAIWTLSLHAAGIPTKRTREYVPEEEYGKMAWGARGVLALHLTAVGLSIGLGSWLPVLYFTLARCYGAFFQWTFILIQHVGMPENLWDHRLSTRSVKLSPLFSFLFMNMENHVEHHLYPSVPFHALPKLHRLVADQLPPRYRSMLDGISDVTSAVLKQLRDPQYSTVRPLPETVAARVTDQK